MREELELLVLEEASLALGIRHVVGLGTRRHTCELRELARFDRQPEEIAVSLKKNRRSIRAEKRLSFTVLGVRESTHVHRAAVDQVEVALDG